MAKLMNINDGGRCVVTVVCMIHMESEANILGHIPHINWVERIVKGYVTV